MEYKIYVGTYIKVKNGFLKGSIKIMYCGMSNESTFVVSPLVNVGYQGFSPSIFYNKNVDIIHIYDREFDLIEVTPEYIIIGD